MFEIMGDEVEEPEIETWMQWSVAAAFAVIYAMQVLLWFFIAERRGRIAKWVYVLLASLFAASMALIFEEYAVDELVLYGISNLLFVASACFLFTPEAREWFAGKIQIDPRVFE